MSSIILIRMSVVDNVLSAPYGGHPGDISGDVVLISDVPACHKVAAYDIARGESVLKFGVPIGVTGRDIKKGEWVHDHNIFSASFADCPANRGWRGPYPHEKGAPSLSFTGFRRCGSRPGIRNDLWIIPAVPFIGGELKYLISDYHKPYWIDAVRLLDIPFGRSAGKENDDALKITFGLARSPNAAGILVIGLDGEDTPVTDIRGNAFSSGDRLRCAFLRGTRDDTEEIAARLDSLAAASPRVRETFPLSELCVGIIGASGRYSGLSANPLLGRFAERLSRQGAVALTPFGTYMSDIREAISERITSKSAYDEFAAIADRQSHVVTPVYDWENGVSTPEERALMSSPINGSSPITGFLGHGETASVKAGIEITPGSDDIASDSALLAACGAQLVMLAAARGNPFGSVVPTVRISSGGGETAFCPEWTDFDASAVFAGISIDDMAKHLEDYAIRVACGEKASHEKRNVAEISF